MKVFIVCIVVLFDHISSAPYEKKLDLEDSFLYDDDYSAMEEVSNYFEGDMILTAAQHKAIEFAKIQRNGLRGGAKRWPNRTIVYHINGEDFDEEQIEMIKAGMEDISNNTCINFRNREADEHAVTIQGTQSGCYSNVGLSTPDDEEEEGQVINFAKGCFKHGTIVHEMLHTIGFYHMQSTFDRDDFVEIVWENIQPGKENNFEKYTSDTVTDFGVPYDYSSVMHYPEKAFSKNENRTIIPLQEDVIIGQRNGLSESDIIKLNKMYCEEHESISYVEKF